MGQAVAPRLSYSQSSTAWEEFSRCVGAFQAAWKQTRRPPDVAEFLPAEPDALRKMVLVELVKVDLQQRWRNGVDRKQVEQYADEFPELAGEDGIPCDVIFEEFQARKLADDQVAPEEYFQRFADKEPSLRRLLRGDLDSQATMSLGSRATGAIELCGQIEDFDLLQELGRGAFATVYLARQRSMQRLVALKVSKSRSDEPQTMAQFDHPNIVRVFDQRPCEDRGVWLMYMEYLAGGTLLDVVEVMRHTPAADRTGALLLATVDSRLAARGVPPPEGDPTRARIARMKWSELVCWIGLHLASALDYAHRRGALHRDIKPANVLLTATGVPKLVDFNIAYCSELQGATPAAFFGGSLAYMSPEQLEASDPGHPREPHDLDGRSDVYSLSVMLWELLCGQRPFPNEEVEGDWPATVRRLIATRRAGPAPEATALLPDDTPPVFREVLLDCLAPEADERPADAHELTNRLGLAMQPKVQQLLRPSRHRRREFVQRHLVAATILAGVVPNLVLSLINIGYNWQIVVTRLDESSQVMFLNWLLTSINAVLYGTGLAIAGAKALPILRTHWARPPNAAFRDLLPRSLKLGDWLFGVVVVCWAAAGITFPVCLRISGGDVESRDFMEFFASHLLCGLIAGVFCYFILNYLVVRFWVPHLLVGGPPAESDAGPLAGLHSRVAIYARLAAAVPFVAAVLLGVSGSGFQIAFGALALLGAIGLVTAFRIARGIQADLETLLLASTPVSESLVMTGGSMEFSTRR